LVLIELECGLLEDVGCFAGRRDRSPMLGGYGEGLEAGSAYGDGVWPGAAPD